MLRPLQLRRGMLLAGLLVVVGLTWQPSAAVDSTIALHDDVYLSVGPTPDEMDHALASLYPQWQDFRQTVFADPWTAGDVFAQASYGGPEYALNSAVLLVAVGMTLDWQEPSDGDLFGRAVQAGEALHGFYMDYYTGEQARMAYPHIGNASTYALFRFLGEDTQQLTQWQRTFEVLFSQDPSLPQPLPAFADAQTVPSLRRPFEQPSDTFYAVNSFFDHSYPRYSSEGAANAASLFRFDGTVFEGISDCVLGVNCYSGHPALDYGVPQGVPVLAAASGRLVRCMEPYGALNVEHDNGLITSYLHMDPLEIPNDLPCGDVQDEQPPVAQGQVIGYVSNKSPKAMGVHLHFGVGYVAGIAESSNADPFGWWGSVADPWSQFEGGQESAWLWRGDEAGDGSLTVDNRESQAQLFRHPYADGDWHRVDRGYQDEAWYAILNAESDTSPHWAIWGTYIDTPGYYEVQAYWPTDPPADEGVPTSAAEYRIYRHINGQTRISETIADQTAQANTWVPLGHFYFEQGATVVMLSDVTNSQAEDGKRVYFDAMRWVSVPPTPTPTRTPTRTPTPTSTPTASIGYFLTGPYPLTMSTGGGTQYAYGVNTVQQPAGTTFVGIAVHTDYSATSFQDAQVLGYSPRLHGSSSNWDHGPGWYCRTRFNGPEHAACVFAASQLGVTFAIPRPLSYWNDAGAPGSTIYSAFRIESFPCCNWPPVTGHLTVYYIWNGVIPTPTPGDTPTPTPTSVATPTPTPTPSPCWCYYLCRQSQASTGPTWRSSGLVALARRQLSLLRQTAELVELLQDVRDQVMAQTSEGRRLIDLYEQFSPNLAETILPDPVLTDEGDAVIDLFVPGLQALVEGRGGEVTITQDQVDAVETFLDHLAAVADPNLQQAIAQERSRRPLQAMVGSTMDQAWQRVNGYSLEWLPPLDPVDPLHVERGDVLAVAFALSNHTGEPVLDPSVALYLIDIVGTPWLGPIGLSSDPDEGLVYEGMGEYHFNLPTESLLDAPYQVVVAFNSTSGVWASAGIWVDPTVANSELFLPLVLRNGP